MALDDDTMDQLKEIPSDIKETIEQETRSFIARIETPLEQGGQSPSHHVVPREGRWAIVPEGANTATGVFETKKEAFQHAQGTAKQQGHVIVVHREDGTVQEIRNYKND